MKVTKEQLLELGFVWYVDEYSTQVEYKLTLHNVKTLIKIQELTYDLFRSLD